MMNVRQNYEVTKSDYRKNSALILFTRFAPILLAIPLPLIFVMCYLLLGTTTTVAAFYIFLALISFGASFFAGILLSIVLYFYRENWLKNLRTRIATDGIKTSEVEWFTRELTTNERRALGELKAANPLLGDAYQETLASRLTATRIVKNAKLELQLVQRRQNKLKYTPNQNAQQFQDELANDVARLEKVRKDAEDLRVESETRLQMIEAASHRGTNLAGHESALQMLTERSAQLPMALEAAKVEDEIRRELEQENKVVNEKDRTNERTSS